MPDRVRVRLAPSPTGPLHVGRARTALFNWLFARHHGGVFVLRIEDTDRQRSTDANLVSILRSLRWLGMDWDEGPDKGGPYGPYFQMQRLDTYREATDRLLAEGKAYKCYCSVPELDAMRQEARANKAAFRYPGRCLRLTQKQIADYEAEGRRPVIRFIVPKEGTTSFQDMIHGEISINNNELDDLVIVKSDGIPTYNFAAVVDDILGVLVLSVVLGTATGGALHLGGLALRLFLAVAFLAAAVLIGLRSAPWLVALVRQMKGRGVLAVSAFIFGLGLAYLGGLLHLAAIIGAFAAGLVLASTQDRVQITEGIQPVVDIFAPVFFATVGMRVNLMLLNPAHPDSWQYLLLAVVLFIVAVATKLLAGYGSLKRGVDRLAIGIGMVPRGEVVLIFASLGKTAGILSTGVYGAVVLAVLLTTLVTPPWLRQRLARRPRRVRRNQSPE